MADFDGDNDNDTSPSGDNDQDAAAAAMSGGAACMAMGHMDHNSAGTHKVGKHPRVEDHNSEGMVGKTGR